MLEKPNLIIFFIITILLGGCAEKQNLFIKIGKKHHINYKTLRAIAEVESNNYPYVINVNRNHIFKGNHYFNNKFTANLYMDTILDTTFANYDIGICQINKRWLKYYHLDNEDLLIPKINIEIAARIYKSNLKSCKYNIYCALSMYNTGKKRSKIGFLYAKKVLKARRKLFK